MQNLGTKLGAVSVFTNQLKDLRQKGEEPTRNKTCQVGLCSWLKFINKELAILKKGVVKETTIEYSQSTSLHGFPYIFESGKNLFASKVIWAVIFVIAAILGIYWSIQVGL